MPKLITRAEAISRIEKEVAQGECLSCYLLRKRKQLIIHRGEYCTVMLTEFPRTWGQTMIVLHEHKTSFSEMNKKEWDEMNEMVRRTAVASEKVLQPQRVFVARTGSADNLLITCPHIHFNIVPVYEAGQRSSDIFTWENGLYDGDEKEWSKLFSDLSSEWNKIK